MVGLQTEQTCFEGGQMSGLQVFQPKIFSCTFRPSSIRSWEII